MGNRIIPAPNEAFPSDDPARTVKTSIMRYSRPMCMVESPFTLGESPKNTIEPDSVYGPPKNGSVPRKATPVSSVGAIRSEEWPSHAIVVPVRSRRIAPNTQLSSWIKRMPASIPKPKAVSEAMDRRISFTLIPVESLSEKRLAPLRNSE